MKNASIVFLQAVLILIALITIIVLIRFPLTEGRAANLDLFSIYADFLIIYVYISSIFFFVALYQAFKLLGFIRRSKVFSVQSVRTLNRIKYCALALCALIILAGVYVNISHHPEDDPAGFTGLTIMAAFATVVVATAAAIFEKLLQNAVDMKSENDLTI